MTLLDGGLLASPLGVILVLALLRAWLAYIYAPQQPSAQEIVVDGARVYSSSSAFVSF